MPINAASVVIGLSYASLLFLISVGLSVVFGLMRFVNLATGALYIVGGYVAWSVANRTDNFWLALPAGAIMALIIGVVIERGFLDRLLGKELMQVSLTLGVAYIVADVTRWIWGGDPLRVRAPEMLRGSTRLFGSVFPTYRLALIVIGAVLAIIVWYLLERTRWGAYVRAGVDDMEMLECLGVNGRRVFSVVFALGALLCGLGGALGTPVTGVSPGIDSQMLLMALIVVVLGGLGSVLGAIVASGVVGMVDNMVRTFWPEASFFVVWVLVALVLIVRPQGLFGRAV
ncbi:branched-chain amino acid ABC transporter permease [Sphaerobacter thermophilus]|jgi:branched-chain amino acid transport system permease protein|uniref:Inner-membrane translocator n=1 Tax=Sphaerobacter thermophilus (strain ATCC 49802 / DSM 20745 / KCCM 41009 / NCIMB 13125 / S 6022) TaxID=479434 RepID=D1C8H3_SPHTD|nr:branched-chain amino acid ABC transporter permease [Sphaerobacter thermophilus]ACZ40116.1 inner-membrane translocator [Sphaerobacter thermophilus DSM 20745]PZN68463.1 MAG: branched-chain amino acid ABC transporter permease [Sphaerobacter thermophilus]